MRPKNLLLFFFLLFSAAVLAQTPGLQWQRMLGGTNSDWGRTIAKLTDGNVVVGVSTSSNNGDVECSRVGDIWLVKMNLSGGIIWKRCLGGTRADEISDIKATPDGGMIVAALTTSNDGDVSGNHSTKADVWLAKLDAGGNIQWQRCYGGADEENVKRVALTNDGGYVFIANVKTAGGDITNVYGFEDMWVVKVDATGNIQWQRTYGGTEYEQAGDVVQHPDGSYLFTGLTASNNGDVSGNHGIYDAWVVKLDQNGQMVWQKCYGGSSLETANSILLADDGYYISGATQSSNSGDVTGVNRGQKDVWVFKINNSGILQWQRSYGGSWVDEAVCIVNMPDGNPAFVAISTSANGDVSGHHGAAGMAEDVWAVKLNKLNGDITWQNSFGGTWYDYPYQAVALNDGSLMVISQSISFDGDVQGKHGDSDAWVIKVGPVNTIKGMVFVDANANGIKDASEKFYTGLVVSEKNGFTYSNQLVNGRFINNVDTGSYTTRVLFNAAYYTSNPASFVSAYTTYTNVDSFTFALVPIPGAKDLSVTLIPLEDAKPGFQADYRIHYKNKGVDAVNASVRFKRDARTSFISSSVAVSSISNDTLIWNFNNLQPLDSGTINLTLQLNAPPVLNMNDTLRHDCVVYPLSGDVIPADNTSPLSQVVVGAVDPNDKTEAHAGKIKYASVLAEEHLNYVIRFQNTGTASAINVVIRDTLTDKLNLQSFEMLSASHAYTLSIKNNQLEWVFRNIFLPDSNANEPASHGYVAFRIKPKTSLITGDIIPNSASIYFDYNLPVKTNTENVLVVNNAVLPVKLSQFEGMLKNKVSHLSWKTSTEQGTKFFEIERSADGVAYKSIGVLHAKGAPAGASYTFDDSIPSKGYNFYRLKIIDHDGKYVYSSIVILQVKTDGDLVISLYPNPSTDGNISLNMYGRINGACVIDVLDIAGRRVIQKNLGSIKAESFSTMLRLAGLQKGVYTVRLSVAGSMVTHKLLIR